jgi:hypothetical protein
MGDFFSEAILAYSAVGCGGYAVFWCTIGSKNITI